ncbi:MAG: alpha/beta hydrolase [Candidatus Eisenbacteria bacterium]
MRALNPFLVLCVLLVPASARAVTPSDKHTALPASTGLTWSAVNFTASRDGADLSGWWFEGKPNQPVLVLFDRGSGSMGDLLPVVGEFVNRGYSVMTFDYRDFGPAGPGAVDSLVQLAFASRWVNDGEGALRFARTKAGARPVFAWGQDVGGAVAVAAAVRDRTNADAVACEGLFRTLNELLRTTGLQQVSGAPERHRFVVETGDEPGSSVANLMVPLHVVIAGKDEVWPATITQEVVRHSLSRIDRWMLPEAGHVGVENTPGYYDRMSGWFTRIANMIKAAQAAAPPSTDAK